MKLNLRKLIMDNHERIKKFEGSDKVTQRWLNSLDKLENNKENNHV